MDSNHPLSSHHHLETTLNDSRKRPNHQTTNYHPNLSIPDGMGQQTAQQQNFLSGLLVVFFLFKNFY